MRDTSLLQLALALTPPWTVRRADFEAEAHRPSTLTGTDPLLLTGIDPASAHVFVVIRPDQPIPDLP
jgi:hypothetical protein